MIETPWGIAKVILHAALIWIMNIGLRWETVQHYLKPLRKYRRGDRSMLLAATPELSAGMSTPNWPLDCVDERGAPLTMHKRGDINFSTSDVHNFLISCPISIIFFFPNSARKALCIQLYKRHRLCADHAVIVKIRTVRAIVKLRHLQWPPRFAESTGGFWDQMHWY